MRRSLALVALAVTTLVVTAFVVPLGLTVRNQARERAIVAAERSAQQVAALIGVAAAGGLQTGDVQNALAVAGAPDVSVFLSDGSVLGSPADIDESVIDARTGRAVVIDTAEGRVVAVPVTSREGVLVVRVVATTAAMTAGVTPAWLFLAGLGLALIAGATLVADRMARSFTRPVSELADTARRLGTGDLTARARPNGPPEIAAVAGAINDLAGRLGEMLAAERESVADLSHRLRTPLTALRLEADRIAEGEERDRVVTLVERLDGAVDGLIHQARRGRLTGGEASDLADLVRRRIVFWGVLAEEQGRPLVANVPTAPLSVKADGDELAAVVDALIGNVFTHTAPGTSFRVEVEKRGTLAVLQVADSGDGFPPGVEVERRGESGAASTGLGLDIVKRLAEQAGGAMKLGRAPEGGAAVVVEFPLAPV